MAGVDLDLVTTALVDQEGLGVAQMTHARQLNLKAELGTRSTVVGRTGTPGRRNELDLAVAEHHHTVVVDHRLAINTGVEPQDLGGLVLAATTRDHRAVLWFEVCGQLQRQHILLLCTRGDRHGVGRTLSGGVQTKADATSRVRTARQNDVLAGDADVAVPHAILVRKVDVEIELLPLAKLTVVVLLGRSEDLEVLGTMVISLIL